LIGAALGLLAAKWVSRILIASLATEHTRVLLVAGLGGRVLVFTGGVLIITVFLFGLAPALAATRGDPSQSLKIHSSSSSGAARHSWLSKSPVVIQVALSCIVLVGAGLLLHSLYNLETYDVGFDRDHVIAISFSCCATGRTPEQSSALFDEIIAKAKSLPGVRSASFSSFSQTTTEVGINVALEGFTPRSADERYAFLNTVSAGYFETLGIPILTGRDFTDRDNASAPLAAIINRTMARHYFGDTNPIGRRFNFVEGKWPPLEIVGVVADSVYNNVREQTPDFIYLSRQQRRALNPATGISGVLDVRAFGNAKLLSVPLRDLVRSSDSLASIAYVRTLRDVIDESLHDDRLIAALCSIFSSLALVLSCVGLYGTLSFSVVRRTSEIGVRMALGARPENIFALVIGQGMRLVIVGLVIGAAGALASASLLAKLLFGVKGADPVTFVGVSVVLIVAAILACYLPARRAMRVDPMTALRYE
jgi:putative ABC transport system permease protein